MTQNELRRIVSNMTLDQKVGQCLTFGFSGSIVTDDFLETFERFHCGGLRLSPYSNNFEYKTKTAREYPFISDADYKPSREKMLPVSFAPHLSPEQYAALIDRFQALARKHNCGVPLHVSVDQEGDMSADIVRGGVALFASQMGMCATGDKALVTKAAGAIARQLIRHGVNMTHAPVLDVNILPDNIESDTRSFSSDPQLCAAYGIAMMKGYQGAGIIATGKHFPGRGNSTLDAHLDVPTIEGSMDEFLKKDLVPFQALIDNGLDAIMIAHTVYPGLDPSGLMATVSPPILKDLLRKRMGFKGIVTSDSITMAALVKKYGATDGSALALKGGCDLILMKEETKLRGEIFHTIKKYVRRGEISMEQLNESVLRILTVKAGRGLFSCRPAAPQARKSFPDISAYDISRKVALKSMIIAKNENRVIPLKKGARIYFIEQIFFDRSPNDYWNHPRIFYEMLLRKGLNVAYRTEIAYSDYDMGGQKFAYDIKEVTRYIDRSDYDLILMTSVFYRNYLTDTDIVKKVIALSPKPVLVLTNTPYKTGYATEARNVILNFATSPAGFEAVIDVLTGKCKATGKLPVARNILEPVPKFSRTYKTC